MALVSKIDNLYALDVHQDSFIVSTFVESLANKIYYDEASIDIEYPVTKLISNPKSKNLFCTTGDYFRLYSVEDTIVEKATLKNVRRVGQTKHELCAPLTSFDWNIQDDSICVTSSVDTTCTVWDMNTLQAKTQLIAHDSDVLDVSFSAGLDLFCSVGQDGSLRMFDQRSLANSTIIYESPNTVALLRAEWNKRIPNYIATFAIDSSTVIIVDIRVPAVPCFELKAHFGNLSCIQWHPLSMAICSGGDDGQTLIWDLSSADEPKQRYCCVKKVPVSCTDK